MKRSATLFDFAPSFFLWEGRELPPSFNGREGMTSFFENPRLSSEGAIQDFLQSPHCG